MNDTLSKWNASSAQEAAAALLHCCASHRWANGVVALRPFADAASLSQSADRVWAAMEEPDWMEAFRAHPRIGEHKVPHASRQSRIWSKQEQASATDSEQRVLDALVSCNARYESQFGFTYIVCATGKTAEEMLQILSRRLNNDRAGELREAGEQQRQIMQIRLNKWLQS